jgi:hypothetical protein
MEIKKLVSVRRGPAWRSVLDQMWYLKSFGLRFEKSRASFSGIYLLCTVMSDTAHQCHTFWLACCLPCTSMTSEFTQSTALRNFCHFNAIYLICNCGKELKINVRNIKNFSICINVSLSILRLRAGRYGVRISIGTYTCLFSKTYTGALWPNERPIQWVLGFFPGRKRPGSDVDLPPPSTAAVKNEWSYTSTYNAHKYGKFCQTFTEFAVLVYICIYLPDDDLVKVETCKRNISDKWLFIIDCAICWIKNCTIYCMEYGLH